MKLKEVKLPSGAVLKIQVAPFAEAKALYQAVFEEAKGIQIGKQLEMSVIIKDILCVGFSSKKIEACLWECFQSCIYNSGEPGAGDLKISKDTFESVKAREDYTMVCMAVTEENVRPFVKGLYAEFVRLLAMIDSIQPSK